MQIMSLRPTVWCFPVSAPMPIAAPGSMPSTEWSMPLRHAVEDKARPFLGICVGMQLMSTRGLEKTVTDGFDWIAGDVVEITPSNPALKIPQIGWNTLDLKNPHPLFDGIPTGPDGLHAYFVHSYQLAARTRKTLSP
jgi:glutamine amidotransferase